MTWSRTQPWLLALALPSLQALSLAAAELPAVRQHLAAVADQQAQQARTTDAVVQSGVLLAGSRAACTRVAPPRTPRHARQLAPRCRTI
jgi:hypothetical protein